MPDSKAELRQLAIDAKWYGLDELVALVDTELAALQWGANVEEVGATDIEETKLPTPVLRIYEVSVVPCPQLRPTIVACSSRPKPARIPSPSHPQERPA